MNSSNFFVQLVVRLFGANPKFFKWIQGASLALLAISGAENALPADFTPSWLGWAKSATVWVSGAVALIIAQLPQKSNP